MIKKKCLENYKMVHRKYDPIKEISPRGHMSSHFILNLETIKF